MSNILNHGGGYQLPPQLKQLMNMVQSSGNPQQMLAQMAQQNPQLAQVMDMCKNGNPQQMFYALCQQKGVNPNDILNQLR